MGSLVQPGRIVAEGVELVMADASRWSYLSLAPWPQTTTGGTPMVSVIEAGDVGFVQLSCQLDPPGPVLERLRSMIAEIVGGEHPAEPITLHSAVTAVDAIRIVAGLAAGETGRRAEPLGHSRGSGFPPYTAAFQLQLDGRQLERARAAIGGESGHLAVQYELTTDDGPATATADVAHWIGATRTDHNAPQTVQEDRRC